MEMPKEVLDLAAEIAVKYGADIEKATDALDRAIRKLPEFEDLTENLLRMAEQELIYDARHQANIRTRLENGGYGGPAKVVSGDSEAVKRVAQSVYAYAIAGTMLGMVLGDQLPDIAASEAARAEGHAFNARLCERLAGMVPKGKRVREVVSEKRLQSIFREVETKTRRDAA